MSVEKDKEVKVDTKDKCTCGVDDSKGIVVNYDMLWGDGHVIHDPTRGGCGKFMRFYDRG